MKRMSGSASEKTPDFRGLSEKTPIYDLQETQNYKTLDPCIYLGFGIVSRSTTSTLLEILNYRQLVVNLFLLIRSRYRCHVINPYEIESPCGQFIEY